MEKILISPAGGQAIAGIIEYFQNRGLFVIGIDSNPDAVGRHFCNAFFPVPKISDPGYAPRVRQILAENSVDCFLSWLDPEILFWNEQYYQGTIPESQISCFAFNFRSDLRELYDKYSLFLLLKNKNIPAPETILASCAGSSGDMSRMHGPVVLKPRIGFGSRETHILSTKEDLDYQLAQLRSRNVPLNDFLVQEFIPGREYTIDLFSTSGTVENLVVRSRLEHRGVSLRGEIVFDEMIETAAMEISAKLRLDGINNIQLIQECDTCYLTDVNLRPSGTIIFSVEAGVDLLQNVLERSDGRAITRFGRPRPLKMVRYLREHFHE